MLAAAALSQPVDGAFAQAVQTLGRTVATRSSSKPATKAPRADGYSIAFANADIADVASAILGDELRLPFSIDPAVTGKMSFRIDKPLTHDQLFSAFESALSLSDVVIVRNGGPLLLVPRAKARTNAGINGGGASPQGRGGPGYQVVTVPVHNANPSDIAKSLEALGPSGIVVQADDRLGLLILSGTSQEIQRARQEVLLFDRAGLEATGTKIVSLKIATAKSVADDVDKLVHASGMAGVQLVTVDRLNAIIIIARSAAVADQVGGWVAKLDTASREEPTALWIFRPRNASAEAIVQALGVFTGGQRAPTGGALTPLPSGQIPTETSRSSEAAPNNSTSVFGGGDIKIGVDKEVNALMVMAPESRWLRLKAALEDLDRPPDQVLIEATVLEVTLTDTSSLGVDWSVVAAGTHLNIVSSQDSAGAIAPTFPGFGVTYMDNNLKAVVTALGSKTKVEVMSAPKLVTLDNQSAELQVGDQVPISVQSSQSTAAPGAPVVVNTEYRDTGVILKIKPRINGDNSVVVELNQEVSAVAQTTTSTINSPTIQQRKFQTVMTLHEGETAALGGLISNGRTQTNAGVPYLMSIPGIGSLFKTHSDSKNRTEIIVLLTTKILRANQPSAPALAEVKANMREVDRGGSLADH